MKMWIRYCAGLVALASWAPALRAQTVVAPAPAAVAPAAAPAAAAPNTSWSFFGISKEGCAQCKDKFCQSQLGILVSNSLKPASLFSGGVFPQCCPLIREFSAAELAKPGAEGAAAKVKKDEAEAKKRREDVRFLSTV